MTGNAVELQPQRGIAVLNDSNSNTTRNNTDGILVPSSVSNLVELHQISASGDHSAELVSAGANT